MDLGVTEGLSDGHIVTKLAHEGRILCKNDVKLESIGIRNYS